MARPLVSVSSVRVSLTVMMKQRTEWGARCLCSSSVRMDRDCTACATVRVSVPASEAPLAQLDRASGYEPGGRRFESCRARHTHSVYSGHMGDGLYRAH